MCLLVVASRLVSGEPLIVGANRDEVLDRPATPITVLESGPPRIAGGRDELSGGTWLAVNQHGVFAGLTNQPLGDAKDLAKRSRGELPLALTRHRTAPAALESFLGTHRAGDYNGAWLLVGDRQSLFFVDFTGLVPAAAVALPPGIHVLENRPIGQGSPKVDMAYATLGEPDSGDDVVAAFRRVLTDHRIPEGDDRPNSANCVHLETFGTRSSCLVRVGAEGEPPRLLVADGPPCANRYVDAGGVWRAADVSGTRDQSRTSGL